MLILNHHHGELLNGDIAKWFYPITLSCDESSVLDTMEGVIVTISCECGVDDDNEWLSFRSRNAIATNIFVIIFCYYTKVTPFVVHKTCVILYLQIFVTW